MHDDAVVAHRLVAGFAGNRHDTLALFARAFGDELLNPEAETLELRRQDERQFVSPAQRACRYQRAESKTGVATRVGFAARVGHRAAGCDDGVDIDAHQRRRHQAKERQRRIASADVGGIDERLAKAAAARARVQRRAFVGNRHEP